MEWNNAQVFEFLELYHGEPAIWNPKHPLHKNKKKVHDSWTRISSSLDVSINDLKAKKNSLMATFRSHRRRKEASIKSGAEEEAVYQPIWFAYEKMEEFLAPVYDCGPTTSTVDADDALSLQPEEQHQNETEDPEISDNETQESTQADEETQLNTSARSRDNAVPATQREKRRRLASQIDDARSQIKKTCATLNNVLTQKKDEKKEADDCDLYGQLLAKKLRNYSIHERHLLMHDIDGYLLQRPPRSAMISPSHFSSYSSSPAPSPINRHAPVSITALNQPSSTASYTLLPLQSPLQVNIPSRPSSVPHEATGNVNMPFPQDTTPHSHQSVLQTAWGGAQLDNEYDGHEIL